MNLRHTHAAMGLRGSIVAIAEFALDFHVCTFLQGAGPVGQLVPADDTVPFGARLLFVAAFLFPAHAGCQREARENGSVRCGSALRVLAKKSDERDAIFAKHVCCLPFVPCSVGATRSEGGPLSRQAKTVFRRLRSTLFALFAKGGKPAI